jgi:hypothetical protein
MAAVSDNKPLMDTLTQGAIARHSRRGFLGGIGKVGLMFVGIAAGFGLGPEIARAYIPCPDSCVGPCNPTRSCCISGGEQCCQYCPCGCCTPPECQSVGTWYRIDQDNCGFLCSCVAC